MVSFLSPESPPCRSPLQPSAAQSFFIMSRHSTTIDNIITDYYESPHPTIHKSLSSHISSDSYLMPPLSRVATQYSSTSTTNLIGNDQRPASGDSVLWQWYPNRQIPGRHPNQEKSVDGGGGSATAPAMRPWHGWRTIVLGSCELLSSVLISIELSLLLCL